MTKSRQENFPTISLRRVSHLKSEDLTLNFPAFGANSYQANLKSIGKTYSHPITKKEISFEPATTSQSISAVALGFGNKKSIDAKRDIFDEDRLQTGYIVRTQEGVFTNTTETIESNLKQLLNGIKKTNGIYLINDKIAFIPYKSFEVGVQDANTFAEGGLARGLEHVSDKIAPKLREIASTKFFKNGVAVYGFHPFKTPGLEVVSLCSRGGPGKTDKLDVDGAISRNDGGGYAFGVLKEDKN